MISAIKTWKLGKIDQCPVYTFYNNSPEMMSVKLRKSQIVNKHLPSVHSGCDLRFFQPDDLYTYGEKDAYFVPLHGITKNKLNLQVAKDIYIHEN